MPQDKSLYHYGEHIFSPDEQEALLKAVLDLARLNHKGCIKLLLKLSDVPMPRDWDGYRARKYPDRQHGYPDRRKIESEADVIETVS